MSLVGKLSATFEMIKVQHSVFALPWAFVAAAYAIGRGPVPWDKLGWILVAMVAARSAAMAFNRIADARLDAENPRTKGRAIPAGRLTVAFTAGFTAVMAALLVVAAWRLNPLCLKLSPVALAVTLGYSYTKRFTALCHWFLGLSLAIAPVGAWLAVRPEWHPLPLLLGLSVMFWIAGADILYACEDLEFDRRKGLRSVPAALGLRAALVVSALCHAATAGALVAVGLVARLGPFYYGAVGAIALLLVYEHAIVKPGDLRRVNRAFFHVNAVVSGVILAGGLLDVAFR
jgi:4-hydroxybenzoate polyprenyltransferase